MNTTQGHDIGGSYIYNTDDLNFLGPDCMTILTTYTCTAACTECCFGCTPQKKGRLTLEQITYAITEAKKAFVTLKYVVFSGGEALLLGKDLYQSIKLASDLGLGTRIVSNGYWATNPIATQKILDKLIEAGLTELNISTGDDHQEWVPFERAVNAVTQAAYSGLRTVMTIEVHKHSKFTFKDAFEHPIINDFINMHPNYSLLSLIQSVWIPFAEHTALEYEPKANRISPDNDKIYGCDNVLDNLVVTQNGQWASCCGLSLDKISELKIGKLGEAPITDIFVKQLHDFLKIWIRVEGPERILKYLAQKDPNLQISNEVMVHPCQACQYLYTNSAVRNAIKKFWHEKSSEILFKFMFMKYPKQLVTRAIV